MLHPETGGGDRELLAGPDRPMGDREERHRPERHACKAGAGVERDIEEQVSTFVCGEARHRSAQEGHNRGSAVPLLRHLCVRGRVILRSRRTSVAEANR